MSGRSDSEDGDLFEAARPKGGLRQLSVRGGAATGLAQGLNFALNLIGLSVVARILGPADYGLLAMVTAFSGLAEMLSDLGLSQATVQREGLTHGQVSTLFWVNVGAGASAAALLCLSAPAISWFYGEPRLTHVAMALSVSFLLSGATAQHLALLRRSMRFVTASVLSVVARAAGVATSISLALNGFGYWSLVGGLLAEQLCLTVGVWIAVRWLPSRPRWASGLRSMLGFGAHLTGSTLVNYFARSADTALVGWAAGPAQLGLYSRAYQLLTLPAAQINTPLTTVALPALSRLQGDPNRYRSFYRQGVGLVATLSMPICAFLFVDAEELILLVLGDKWVDAAPIFRLLAPAAFVGTFNVATEWVYISLGQVGRLLRWGTFSAVVRVLSYAVGVHWGAVGVAAAYSLSVCALRIPSILYCFRGTPLTMADLTEVLWRPTAASLGAAALLGGAHAAGVGVGGLAGLGLDLAIYSGLFLGVMTLLPGGAERLRQLMRLVGDLRGTSEAAASS